MDMSQELLPLFAILIVLIPLSRSESFVTVTEDEAVRLDFPYPCDSYKVTIQIANRLPFYSSAKPESLNLPSYQLNRFSVTDENCTVEVQINPVKRSDQATYICQAYMNGALQSELTRMRLNVNYPPGAAVCSFSINGDAVGDWVPLQCMASVGSLQLAGEIYCYQDSKRLPPWSNLVQTGETLKQTIWARKEYPVFCCSSTPDRPEDVCECKDFVWNPIGDIPLTNTIIDLCPATTPEKVATSSQNPKRQVGENSQPPQLIESQKPTNTNKNKSIIISAAVLWGGVTVILVIIVVIIIISVYMVAKTKMQLTKCQSADIHKQRKNIEVNESSESPERKKNILHNHIE